MPVLDTDLLIALEQGDPDAVQWVEAHRTEDHFVPDVVAVEYLTGHSDVPGALEALEEAFLIVHGDRDWVRSAVDLRKALRTKKVRFRTPDLWIAAWAHHLDDAVVTRNTRHFEALGVVVERW